jgi:hypothetical protein
LFRRSAAVSSNFAVKRSRSLRGLVADPPDVELNDAMLSTTTGVLTDLGTPVTVPHFLVPAPANGVPIRVLVVHNITIQRLLVDASPDFKGAGLAIVATGDIAITGLLEISPNAGVLESAGCTGGNGIYATDCLDVVSGAGGGANATNGGKGGTVTAPNRLGGAGGIAAGTTQIVPLRGGCSGGGTDGPDGPDGTDGMGGGAVQLTSATKINVGGIVSARGQGGSADRYRQRDGFYVTGGGAGGSLLLEAPVVTLDANAQLDASGGGGAALCSTATTYCGTFGAGAHSGTAAQPGGNATCDGVNFASAGAGGGGLGRIRINTRDGMYTKANTAVEDGSLTTGMHATR